MITQVQAREIFIAQVPNKDNGYHAVCTTRIVSASGQVFTAIGEFQGEDEASGQSALQRAAQSGFERAVELMRSQAGAMDASTATTQPPWDEAAPISQPTTKRSSKIGGKPITEKQKWLIETTAFYNGKSREEAEMISQKLYERPISALTTKEVNPILDILKS